MAGLAIDVGTLRYEKRLQQNAADSAAIAGASNIAYGGITAGAQNASATNGFADGTNNVTVTVNNPPVAGPHTGDASYVEVLVAAVQPTYFMRIFGVNSQAVTARAVATNLGGGAGSGCLYTLGAPNSSIEGVNINGSAILNAPTCGIVDNGDFNSKGNALDVNAGTFGIAGSWPKQGGTVTCTESATCPTIGMPASGDPLAYLTPPCSPCSGGTPISISGNGIFSLNPGTYTSISISGTGNGNTPTVVLNPGTYIIDTSAGFTVTGNATISGSGVTLYFTNGGTFNTTGGGNNLDFQLSPPTSGQYAGILMYQDPNDTTGPQLGGDNQSSFQGTLYFPKAQLTFFGNNVTYNTGIVVADAIALSGNPTVNLKGTAGLPAGVTVIKTAVLVE
jgi:hypothetical protein